MTNLSKVGILASICICLSAGALQSDYEKAVSSYLHDDYKAALPLFEKYAKENAADPKVHYYLALCYQQLDNDSQAAKQYELALKESKDDAFNEIVKERLRRTQRRLGLVKSTDEETAPKIAEHQPVAKVIWFSTNWCSHCKKFASAWDKGKSRFKDSIAFEHYNAEDPEAWKQVEIYRPKAYPTLVYLDGKNNVIENHADAPSSEEFIKHLQDLGAAK